MTVDQMQSAHGSSDAAAVGGVAVRLADVGRRFGSTLALSGVSLDLAPGRIHAFVGQNGAGKSTCLGVIAGRITASTGDVVVGGKSFGSNASPISARAAGVASIYQELTIVPAMTAWENVFLGRMRGRAGMTDRGAMLATYRELCARLGVDIAAHAPAGTLSLADQQMLEIMRALTFDSRVLLLDEPTAALSPHERASLFRVMQDLRNDGVCIVFVSHYLDEVLAQADDIAVFRDGKLIDQGPASDWTEARLVHSMLGRELAVLDHLGEVTEDHDDLETATTALRVRGLSVGKVRDVDLDVRPGEIVGIAGLAGSGRSTLLRALAGVQPASEGDVAVAGRDIGRPASPRAAWEHRVNLIPEDRKISGLALGLTSADNIVLSDLRSIGARGVVQRRRLRRRLEQLADEVGLDHALLDRPAGQLSGGNQQKLLFARWALRRPTVLLADEATRGIDIGAKGQVLEMLRRLADEGMAVLFVSSDLEEVIAVSDRIHVMRAGRFVHHFTDTSSLDQQDLLTPAFGLEHTA